MNRPLHAPATREVRFLQTRDLHTEKRGDKTYLVGYAANYNVLSEDLGGWRERIMPGAFARAVREQQDARHLQNHDANFVLGRTKAGTTVLTEDAQGLKFETLVGMRSYERDLAESIDRGDVDGNSFAFIARNESWVEERDADTKKKIDVRELRDLDLVDISTVTYPAYPGTSVGLDSRALFPAGAPVELRSRVQQRAGRPSGEAEVRAICDRTRSIVLARRSLKDRLVEVRSAAAADGVLELMIYDDIGEDFWCGGGITAKGIKAQIDAAGAHSSMRLRINSLGGDMFEAVAIYNLLRAQGKTIECCVDGVAASAASLLAMAGDTITMGTGALMMIHCASSRIYGNAAEMRMLADFLETCDGAVAEIYQVRTKKPASEIQALMAAESWMGGQECLDGGFCTALAASADTACECTCAACMDGRCDECNNAECEDSNCLGCPMQSEEAIATAAARSSHLLASFRNAPDRLKELAVRTKDAGGVERRMRLRLAQRS